MKILDMMLDIFKKSEPEPEPQPDESNQDTDKEIPREDLKKMLDLSSGKNQNIFFTFLIFEIYMMLIVAGTTDMQLLMPESKISLPLINFGIPLFGFYVVAPLFMIAIHLILNVLEHVYLMEAFMTILI